MFNIKIYNKVYNTNLDENDTFLIDFNKVFDLTKLWIKKEGFTIITINNPEVEEVEITLFKKDNKEIKISMIDEKEALFSLANDLINYLEGK